MVVYWGYHIWYSYCQIWRKQQWVVFFCVLLAVLREVHAKMPRLSCHFCCNGVFVGPLWFQVLFIYLPHLVLLYLNCYIFSKSTPNLEGQWLFSTLQRRDKGLFIGIGVFFFLRKNSILIFLLIIVDIKLQDKLFSKRKKKVIE